jgi:hypothetical protein
MVANKISWQRILSLLPPYRRQKQGSKTIDYLD